MSIGEGPENLKLMAKSGNKWSLIGYTNDRAGKRFARVFNEVNGKEHDMILNRDGRVFLCTSVEISDLPKLGIIIVCIRFSPPRLSSVKGGIYG